MYCLSMAVSDSCVLSPPPFQTHRGSAGFGEPLDLAEFFVNFPAFRELEDQEHASLVVKVTVKAKDVWVPEMALNFDLAAELVLDFRIHELLLEKDFERDDEFPGFGRSVVSLAPKSKKGKKKLFFLKLTISFRVPGKRCRISRGPRESLCRSHLQSTSSPLLVARQRQRQRRQELELERERESEIPASGRSLLLRRPSFSRSVLLP